MLRCQIRLVSEDVLLETIEMDAAPNLVDEVLVGGEAYVVAAPPSEVVEDEAIVYVSRVA